MSASSSGPPRRSPRETFITVYGRKPVEEVLLDSRLTVDKLIVADTVAPGSLRRTLDLAKQRSVRVETSSAQRVKYLAGNGKHDQGVVADVVAPGLRSLEEFAAGCPADANVILLDGVSNPSNVGMIIRTATAAGLDGIVLPSAGSPGLGPLVIKASAGIAFRATIVRCRKPGDALRTLGAAGFTSYGLDASAATTLYEQDLGGRSLFVLGNETEGLSASSRDLIDVPLSIPMANGVDSLNVASAAAVIAFELARRSARPT